MPQPSKKKLLQPRSGPSQDALIATSNETSLAFLGVRRPPWMTPAAATAPSKRDAGHGSSRHPRQPPKPKPKPNPPAPLGGSTPSLDARAAPAAQQPNKSGAAVLPSPVLSSEPSPAASTPSGNDSVDAARQPLASPVAGSLPTHAHPLALSPPSGSVSSVEPADEAPCQELACAQESQATNQAADGSLTTASSALLSPPGLRMPLRRPTSSHLAAKRTAPHPDPAQGQIMPRLEEATSPAERPQKRSRNDCPRPPAVDPPNPLHDGAFLNRCFHTIDRRLGDIGGLESLQLTLERPRYKLLRDACVKGDVFYILLHQVLCLWSMDKASAHALLEPGPLVVDAALDLLLCALRKNSDLSPDHLRWFASFPLNLDHGTDGIPSHSHIFSQINTFLTHFVQGWDRVLSRIEQRRYPVLIWELTDILKCLSPVLQEILFTSSRRRLGIDDGKVANELQRLFMMDRKNESPRDVHGNESARMRNSMGERYKAVIYAARGSAPIPMHVADSAPVYLQRSPNTQPAPYASGNPLATVPAPISSPVPLRQPSNTQSTQPPYGPDALLAPAPVSNSAPDPVQRLSNTPYGPRTPLAPGPIPNPAPVLLQSPSMTQSMAPTAYPPMPSHRIQPSAMQPRTLGAFGIVPSSHQGLQDGGSTRPPALTVDASRILRSNTTAENHFRPIHDNRQSAVMAASPLLLPSQLLATGQSYTSRTTAFPHAPVPASPATSRLAQAWASSQQYQAMMSPAMQQQLPGAWAVGQATQPAAPPVALYTLGPYMSHPAQGAPYVHQPLPQWPMHSGHGQVAPVNYHYQNLPQRQFASSSLSNQMSARQASVPTHSQHSVALLSEADYPRDGWMSVQNSLHLLSLRSPRRVPSEPCKTRFYQFVSRLAVAPKAVPPQQGLRTLQFMVSQDELSKTVTASDSDELPTARYYSGSLRYRLRLCKQNRATQLVQASDWAVCPSFWPAQIFVEFNGQPIQPRRRQHFQHDLPMELTNLLQVGENTVKVSLPGVAANVDTTSAYFIGVEVVTTLDVGAVRSMVVEANEHFSSNDTRREIERRLKPAGTDDLIVEASELCIAVVDPFSSSLFSTPVRGVACKHVECFDLEIWLQTRPCKQPGQGRGEPSVVDCWKCPICGLDARPVNLGVDDFFSEVRGKLVEDGCGGTKKISINRDGSWKPVEEEGDDAEEEGLPDEPFGTTDGALPGEDLSAARTVIVLDD